MMVVGGCLLCDAVGKLVVTRAGTQGRKLQGFIPTGLLFLGTIPLIPV